MPPSSFHDLRWLHIRLRLAGFRMRGLRKASAPAKAIEVPDAFEIGASEDWGRYLKRLDDRLRSPDTHSVAPRAKAIANVVTYGLNQLKPASIKVVPDMSALNQAGDQMVNAGARGKSEAQLDFIELWKDAIARELGAEELEAFSLTLGEPDHDGHRK